MRSHLDTFRAIRGGANGMACNIYIILYIVLLVSGGGFSSVAQEPETASSSDVLANIDRFLSEGLEEEASATTGVAAGPASSTMKDTYAGESATEGKAATESARPDESDAPEGWMPLPVGRQKSSDEPIPPRPATPD
ncbi:MAG TPA: hypothetical protein PLY73_07180, partial [Candidatus Ozemobacteraceae bacterium]|nr:hypothetical protein [Candidatus Ozemobacteraceae bacterium]